MSITKLAPVGTWVPAQGTSSLRDLAHVTASTPRRIITGMLTGMAVPHDTAVAYNRHDPRRVR